MTPLAMQFARELTLPKRSRTIDDRAGLLDLFTQDLHCFEVSAIAKSVDAVLDDPHGEGNSEQAWEVWRDVGTMLPHMFLPSPVTWLEREFNGNRFALVLSREGDFFHLAFAQETRQGIPNFSMPLCNFRPCSILVSADRVEVKGIDNDFLENFSESREREESRLDLVDFAERVKKTGDQKLIAHTMGFLEGRRNALEGKVEQAAAGIEALQMMNRFIGSCILTLDLINTPGLIGLKQHDPHRGIAKQLSRVGSYPLHGWWEVVLKAQTRYAGIESALTGPVYHKCLHFVRSHERHYQSGKVSLIPAHWRGDPALGIKRTRYRLETAIQ